MPPSDAPPANERVTRFGQVAGVLLFFAVLYAPLPDDLSAPGRRLLAITALMACYWLTSAVPIAVTSLIPLAAFPLLGILRVEEVSADYINDKVFLYFGGFVIALGIERWGLHRRIALHIVRVLGTGPRRVVLGFMVATAFLSMWISNTATTLLMLPIALALMSSLRELIGRNPADPDILRATDRMEVGLLLGIAYAASIGGMTTLVGTPTNVAFLGIFKEQFSGPGVPELSTGRWIAAFLPLGVTMLLVVWALLTITINARLPLDRRFFREEIRNLGPVGRGEWLMLAVFTTTALLWIFRKDLQFGIGPTIPGWDRLVQFWLVEKLQLPQEFAKGAVNDSTVAMTMCVLMFLIPVERDAGDRRVYLMSWETLHGMPWGIILLFGGGFAIAHAFAATELSEWVGGHSAAALSGQPLWLLVGGVCLMLTFLTEFTTNVATVAALLPVLASMAVTLQVDPRLIMIPATLSTSCAFMLPIATPPNAIVFGSGRLKVDQMARYGLWINLLGVVLITLTTFLIIVPQWNISVLDFPAWAQPKSAQ